MSALTDLFTAMANRIRFYTEKATRYTPSEMATGGIDDVFEAGREQATTPITPSNASPASMTSGTGYKPTANGYAIQSYYLTNPSNYSPALVFTDDMCKMMKDGHVIESYDSVTPSSSPVSVESGDIVKIGGSGVIVDSIPTPTSITPDNSSPVQMTTGNEYSVSRTGYAIQSYDSITPSSTPESVSSGDIVKIGGSGVIVDAIPTPTSITPSNASPVALTADTPVNPTTGGYAIESYTAIEPSTSPPVLSAGNFYKPINNGYLISNYSAVTPSADGTYFVSGFRKMSSSGYAYSQKPSITKIGSGSYSGTSEITVNLGFKPKYLAIFGADTSTRLMNIYDEDVSTTQFLRAYGSAYATWVNIGTTPYCIKSITNTGFSVSGFGSVTAGFRYFAIG